MAAKSSNVRFTDARIRSLKPKADRYEVWELGRRGFGLRVAPSGRKSWIFLYRFDGKARRMTLGTYPRIKLAQAHDAHGRAERRLDEGHDPGKELVNARKAQREAETVKDLFDEYMKRHATPNKKTAGEDERIFNKDVLPAWGSRKATSITRRDAILLLDGIVDRGSPIMANRTLSMLSKVWKFGLQRDIVDASPFIAFDKPAKEKSRDRVLENGEIPKFWNGLDKANMPESSRLILRLLLVTVQRRSEVVLAQKSEFDLEGERVWTIPGDRTGRKNGMTHLVPLSQLAITLIKQAMALNEESPYLFPSRRIDGPLLPGPVSHDLHDSLGVMGLENLTPHDLRRSGSTGMTSIGITGFVADRVRGKAIPGVSGTYDRYSYFNEKRHALDAWGTHLEHILSGSIEKGGKVVNLADRR